MFLSQLKLWNFRKYGGGGNLVDNSNQIRKPDLLVNFKNGLNVLIGENDSGKTAVIDAIKLILKTHSTEWIRVNFEDFYKDITQLKIECIFQEFSINEAAHFTEWLGMRGDGDQSEPYLKLILEIQHNGERILPFEVRAGADEKGNPLSAEARDYLKTTYLRPLRDAQNELIPKRNSRLSQILEGNEIFRGKAEKHKLKDISRCFNCLIQKYFDVDYCSPNCDLGNKKCPFINKFFDDIKEQDGKIIRSNLNTYIHEFLGNTEIQTKFDVTPQKLKNILELLKLSFDEEFAPGLGSQNLLFIASELLNLDRSNWSGLRLGLIEELEAHLHPQAQLRIISFLQKFIEQKKQKNRTIQIILTTHSPNLGSKVDLENILICSNDDIFPMGNNYTKLKKEDYRFLQRFLDVTKANLFFATGVILVEGFSEELVLPVLARKIGCDLTKNGVSIVNVGGVAFLRYSKIFQRKDDKIMKTPVSIVTDLDLKPEEENKSENGKTKKSIKNEKKCKKYEGDNVKVFISPHWTFEYCISSSIKLRKIFYKSVLFAFKEYKDYSKEELIGKIDKIISDIDLQFNSWQKENIQEIIYKQILGEEKIDLFPKTKIPKPIIAQYFANLLDQDESIDKNILENDQNIKYLINAIKYASGERIEDSNN
ncbi:MAG: ATP-dependent nuclease [bacterium]